jgi:hypothetical protein
MQRRLKRLALLVEFVAVVVLLSGCAQHEEGFSGPSVNMEEDVYRSEIERQKDKPGAEREVRVDFFKSKTKF